MADHQFQPETLAIHAGQVPDSATGARALPIYQTTSFVFDSAEHAASLFNLQTFGNIYSRLSNPTVAALEERVAALEGGRAGLASASGMASEAMALMTILQQGDHVVAAGALYGGSVTMLAVSLKRFGIETTTVDATDVDAWAKARRPNTKAFFLETPSNPGLEVSDIRAIADLAHDAGAKVVVDNAFASPIVQRPMDLGADVVAYSATKLMDGQGRVLAGAVLGSEQWMNDVYLAFARHTGPNLSPFNAWVVLKSLETLDLRVRRQCDNALAVARFLETRVPTVRYPGLASHPQHALARRQMMAGGTIIALLLDGGQAQAHALLDGLELIDISNNLGDSRSLMTHPATTTHYSVSPEVRAEMGITDGMLRLSVGLEDPADLVDDLDQALARAGL